MLYGCCDLPLQGLTGIFDVSAPHLVQGKFHRHGVLLQMVIKWESMVINKEIPRTLSIVLNTPMGKERKGKKGTYTIFRLCRHHFQKLQARWFTLLISTQDFRPNLEKDVMDVLVIWIHDWRRITTRLQKWQYFNKDRYM